jgi:hypothetical protein
MDAMGEEEGGEDKQDKADPQAAAKEAGKQAKKMAKATTKTAAAAASGEQVDTKDMPVELAKVGNEVGKLQKKLQAWAKKTAAKIPSEDKEARMTILKIPMAIKIAGQNIAKVSKTDNDNLKAALGDEEAQAQEPAEGEEPAAANRKEEDLMGYLRNLVREEVNECGGMPFLAHPSEPEKIRIVVGKRDEEDEEVEEALEIELNELLTSELNPEDDK